MMAQPERFARKVKRTDVNYAVLASGQQIPEYSTEEDDSEDETYGSHKKKRRKKQGKTECFICHRPSRTYKSTMLQCDHCSRLYHGACGKPFQSASILGNTSCYECLQEAKVHSLSALPRTALTSIADFVKVLKKAKRILVIAGAGMSVSCGIPDFRSKDGIYAMARHMDVVLPEPECLFQIEYFRDDPAPFYEVVRTVFATSPTPSPTHMFLKLLQDKKKLLRVYTQNIDGLEQAAGVTRCIPCHGSFSYSACMRCKKRVETTTLMPVIQAGIIPTCSEPTCRGVLKPEITFFGEILDDKVSTTITKDRLRADLLLVIGTSLKVAPVMEIPGRNMSRLSRNTGEEDATDDEEEFDLSLLGDCDDITRYICELAGWSLDAPAVKGAKRKPVVTSSEIIAHAETPDKRVFCFRECHCKNKLAAGMNDETGDEEAEAEDEVEDDIVCNRCEERIDTDAAPGSRSKTVHYRCNDCFDYDLCGDCYPKRKLKHKGGRHSFTQCL
ncbi:hypothetical protein PsorP6_017074 [Peronosclerospora sorghi]|uniref:Uncharacterized protein n=1 Tax=Peronosclerospora sorghi TaxID=230839 RepID=A0ACC0WDK6_9STRA|nr:hypothetical protein PsorP6_017074 [Peronosclerospora sorghi]